MTTTPNTNRPGGATPVPSVAMYEAHERMLRDSAARSRYLEVRSGRRVHVLEAGDGPPVLHLHGASTSALSHLLLLERMPDVRSIAVDRPGCGLSEPVSVPREHFRGAAIEFIDEVLDALDLESAVLACASMGGIWGLWYALARPERVTGLVLLGSAPCLPGYSTPVPLRVTTAPLVGDLLARYVKPHRKMVVRMMASVGEKDTIVRHPDLLDAVVAAGMDPIASAANLAEVRAVVSPFGFRPSMRIQPAQLRRLTVPTLVIWGDHDPGGGVAVAQAAVDLMPDAELEVLPAGHVPWLGHPDRVAELLSTFVR